MFIDVFAFTTKKTADNNSTNKTKHNTPRAVLRACGDGISVTRSRTLLRQSLTLYCIILAVTVQSADKLFVASLLFGEAYAGSCLHEATASAPSAAYE